MRAKGHAVVGYLAQLRQGEHLKATTVGQDRTIPAHELVQAASLFDNLGTGPQVQVIGVAQNDLRLDVMQLGHGDSFHRGPGADWHKDRRLNGSASGLDRSGTSSALAVLLMQSEHYVASDLRTKSGFPGVEPTASYT